MAAASVVDTNLATLHSYPVADVSSVTFMMQTFEDMARNAVVVVTEAAKNPGGNERNTPHDPRLGTIAMNGECEECGMEAASCSGHDGLIIFNTHLAPQEKNLRVILKHLIGLFCAGCGRLIMDDDLLRKTRREAEETRESMNEAAWHLQLIQAIYQQSVGMTCHAHKDLASHPNEVFFSLEPKTEPFKTAAHVEGATSKEKNAASIIYPLEFYYEAMERLTEEQLFYLGFADPVMSGTKMTYVVRAHPKALIARGIPVIPICSRAPQAGDTSSQTVFHPITKSYNKIVQEANFVKVAKDNLEHELAQKRLGRGATEDIIRELEMNVQTCIDKLNNALLENYETNMKDILSNKKRGIIRGEAQGKITEELGRTVVVPDPRRRPGEVSVPRKMASKVTTRVVVSPSNIGELTDLLKKGAVKRIYPHTATIRGSSIQVTAVNRAHLTLQIGDSVARDLQDGDYLLFIRQPALSGLSVVAAKIFLWDKDVFGFALEEVEMRAMDFDGDQAQGLSPQSMEAAAELASIGSVEQLMINAKDQSLVFGIHQDGVIGPVLMTSDPLGAEGPITEEKGWVTRALFDRITVLVSDACLTDISREGKKLGIKNKLEDFQRRLALHDKIFSRTTEEGVEVVPTDVLLSWGFPSDIQYKSPTVTIRDGIIIKGIVDKTVLGRTQDTLLHIIAETDRDKALRVMKDVAIIGTSWLSFYGMSVSWRDCAPVRDAAQRAIGLELAQMMTDLEALVAPVDALDTRRYNAEWEAIISATSGRIDKLVQGGLDPNNRIAKMLVGKGSAKHLNSIAAILGQQYIAGKLPVPGVTEGTRYSWWFDADDREPTNQGMCTSNLGDGITPAEAIHTAAAARINFINLNVTTPDIGKHFNEMSRVLQGVITTDYASCTDGRRITTSLYGSDGLTPDRLARKKQPNGTLEVRFADLQAFTDELNAQEGWYRA